MRPTIGMLLLALGCGGGSNFEGDQDGRDGGDAGDDGGAGDGSPDGGDDSVEDGRVPDAADGAGPDADGAVDAPLSGCPAELPGEGPVRFSVRWRHVEPWAWASPGSAGVGVIDGVVFAVQPSSPWVDGSEPFDVWLDAATGEPLPFERRRTVTGARAVAVRTVDDDHFDVAAFAPGVGDTPADPFGAFALPEGTSGGGWSYSAEMYGYGIVLPSAAHLVGGPESTSGTIDGRATSREWGVDAGDLWGGTFPLYRGPELAGDAFGAFSGTSSGERHLWTVNSQLVLTAAGLSEILRVPLPWGAAYVPASPSRPGVPDSDFLIAGRSDYMMERMGLRVEKRRATDLALLSQHFLDEYDSFVERPEARELAGDAGVFALAWVGQRLPDESGFACLWATPLDEDGAPTGPAARIDDAPVPLEEAPVEHVRVILRDGSFFVLWRRAPDMWLARVDHADL